MSFLVLCFSHMVKCVIFLAFFPIYWTAGLGTCWEETHPPAWLFCHLLQSPGELLAPMGFRRVSNSLADPPEADCRCQGHWRQQKGAEKPLGVGVGWGYTGKQEECYGAHRAIKNKRRVWKHSMVLPVGQDSFKKWYERNGRAPEKKVVTQA